MKRLTFAAAFCSGALLAASGASAQTLLDTFENDIEELRKVSFDGTSFTQNLAGDYKDFALYEADVMYDWIDAEHFAQKAKSAATGKIVAPEMPENWSIESKLRMAELQQAREVLVSVLDAGARNYAPNAAAYAQAKYDCWVEQQEEGWQYDHIAACRNEFLQSVVLLRAALEPNYPELAERLYFEFDQSDLTLSARMKLDKLAQEIKADAPAEVIVIGHADRVGTPGYNMKLSALRAKTVANALRARGVKGVRIDYDVIAMGESAPALKTGDGVRSQANRRVAVYIDEPEVTMTLIRAK